MKIYKIIDGCRSSSPTLIVLASMMMVLTFHKTREIILSKFELKNFVYWKRSIDKVSCWILYLRICCLEGLFTPLIFHEMIFMTKESGERWRSLESTCITWNPQVSSLMIQFFGDSFVALSSLILCYFFCCPCRWIFERPTIVWPWLCSATLGDWFDSRG